MRKVTTVTVFTAVFSARFLKRNAHNHKAVEEVRRCFGCLRLFSCIFWKDSVSSINLFGAQMNLGC